MTNEKIVGFIPASFKLTDIIKDLKIPLDLVQKTSLKTKYDRYLIKIGTGTNVSFRCISKHKYFSSVKKKGLPISSVFIDYESWFYSLKFNYKERPNLRGFFDDISNLGTIKHIYFFGNFTEEMKGELPKIRKYTNNIIECYGQETKEFSDVIMLDYIYRYVLDFPNVEQYFIFTNDGHFLPLLNTLQNSFNKTVITVGVQNQINSLLFTASRHHISIIPGYLKDLEKYWFPILKDILYSENNGKLVTFTRTIEYNVQKGMDEGVAYSSLNKLVKEGYIDFEEVNMSGKTITVMYPNWAKLKEDGIFDFEQFMTPANKKFNKRTSV